MSDDERFRRRVDPRREPDYREERTSSNDLVFEQMREFLVEHNRLREDGITLRALNRQLTEHTEADERRHKELDDRTREIAERAAEHTGRLQLAPPPVIIGSTSSKRHSKPFLAGFFDEPKRVMALFGALTVLAHALLKLLH